MLQASSSPRSYIFLFIMWGCSRVTKRWFVANITSPASISIVDNYAKRSLYSLAPLPIPSLPNLNKEKAGLTKAKLSASINHTHIQEWLIMQDGLKLLHSGQYNEAQIINLGFQCHFHHRMVFSFSEALQQQRRHRMATQNIWKTDKQTWNYDEVPDWVRLTAMRRDTEIYSIMFWWVFRLFTVWRSKSQPRMSDESTASISLLHAL